MSSTGNVNKSCSSWSLATCVPPPSEVATSLEAAPWLSSLARFNIVVAATRKFA
jgi:hypothetical protein